MNDAGAPGHGESRKGGFLRCREQRNCCKIVHDRTKKQQKIIGPGAAGAFENNKRFFNIDRFSKRYDLKNSRVKVEGKTGPRSLFALFREMVIRPIHYKCGLEQTAVYLTPMAYGIGRPAGSPQRKQLKDKLSYVDEVKRYLKRKRKLNIEYKKNEISYPVIPGPDDREKVIKVPVVRTIGSNKEKNIFEYYFNQYDDRRYYLYFTALGKSGGYEVR